MTSAFLHISILLEIILFHVIGIFLRFKRRAFFVIKYWFTKMRNPHPFRKHHFFKRSYLQLYIIKIALIKQVILYFPLLLVPITNFARKEDLQSDWTYKSKVLRKVFISFFSGNKRTQISKIWKSMHSRRNSLTAKLYTYILL